ncbi:RNA polymerase sigma factor [Aquibacillus koreensis]|uniref:RNA polymerase sigma factor n=1 Tax=Aquibacillus koreensis TaxID=279446 RepID=A0A9X3WQ04_9BACI|nr:RNA polymerase sigma factor [Aquibacillus koreensis]MCT2534940.1 RNA polymerase sigma factor [Aquibacillus koreensis]MDC3422166.1 RNA polymerase sigma factor [Aquibacillus koreensis]
MEFLRLVKKAQKGNKEALLQLIMEQQNEYYRLAYTYMGNQHDALDAMEDMIVKLYENIDTLKKRESFYSWSKTILVNCCKTMIRKKQKIVLIDDWDVPKCSDQDYYESTKDQVNREHQMDIENMLKHVNEKQAEAIQLKYLHDLDYQSIAEMTNVSVGTVKSRVFQGLKKMQQVYGGGKIE